jgi:hypothetical protein
MTNSVKDMGLSDAETRRFYRSACGGNEEAVEFLSIWNDYTHQVDDVIDNDDWSPESLLECFYAACRVYSHPFYRRNSVQLQIPAVLATNSYADSVKWEKAREQWKRDWASVIRHGSEMTFAVFALCGGCDSLRQYSRAYLAVCYTHDANENPEVRPCP